MSHEELLALLTRARAVLGHYLFDESRVAVKRVTLERSAA
jgi:hypothetical protein